MSDLEELALFHLRLAGLPAPETEYKFHPVRRWRFDLCWPDRKIAAELEGAVWAGGRHTRGGGYEGDCTKYNTAAALGWRVYRFTRGMVERGEFIETMTEALK